MQTATIDDATYPDVQNKVAFISGSSRGIGLGIARILVQQGATVILNGRREEFLRYAARDLGFSGKGAVSYVAGDITDQAVVARSVRQITADHGRIDILVANAGGLGNPQPTEHLSAETWRSAIEANLTSPFLLIKAFLPTLLAQGSGTVITVSSTAGRQPSLANLAYGAAKAGIILMTRQLATEFGPRGLRFNGVAPGPVLTEESGLNRASEEVRNQLARSLPLQRIGLPEDVARAVLFLASDASSWITGVTLDVSGGKVTT